VNEQGDGMSVSEVQEPQPPVTALEPQTLEQLFEIVSLELMAVLDHVEENHGVEVTGDPKLRGANKLLGLYILWRQGDVSLPWLAEQLANSMAKNHPAGKKSAANGKAMSNKGY
jgi:hypothetical protein